MTFVASHPYLITNESTLADVNNRINKDAGMVKMGSFRANIIIGKSDMENKSLLQPYDEVGYTSSYIIYNLVRIFTTAD